MVSMEAHGHEFRYNKKTGVVVFSHMSGKWLAVPEGIVIQAAKTIEGRA